MSEGAHEHHYTTMGVDNRKLGMWLLIASECMLFGTLIVTYMIYRTKSVVGPHPTEVLDIPITTISTFVLLMSSFSIVLALHAIQHGDHPRFRKWILTTALGGLVFLGFQTYEFTVFVQEGLADAKRVQQQFFHAHRHPRHPRCGGRDLDVIPVFFLTAG